MSTVDCSRLRNACVNNVLNCFAWYLKTSCINYLLTLVLSDRFIHIQYENNRTYIRKTELMWPLKLNWNVLLLQIITYRLKWNLPTYWWVPVCVDAKTHLEHKLYVQITHCALYLLGHHKLETKKKTSFIFPLWFISKLGHYTVKIPLKN
jgi:hypothetical protein